MLTARGEMPPRTLADAPHMPTVIAQRRHTHLTRAHTAPVAVTGNPLLCGQAAPPAARGEHARETTHAHIRETMDRGGRLGAYFGLKLMMREKASALRLAPPTSAPSMSGHAIRSSTLASLTLPPYWMMTASATSWL